MPFLSLHHITVRYLDKTLFENLSWNIEKGQQWAIVGPSGAGKTTLLNTIAGKYNVINGHIDHHYYNDYKQTHTVTDPYFTYRDLIAQVGHHHDFKNRSNVVDFYYQQRFNSSDSEDALTVSEYLYDQSPGAADNPTLQALIAPLNVTPLLKKAVIKLSNGETRRTLIAKALLKNPALLLLDNPFIGLDVQARQHLHNIIDHVVAAGTTVIVTTTPGEIPPSITHVLTLENATVSGEYTRDAYIYAFAHETEHKTLTLTSAEENVLQKLITQAPTYNFQQIVHMENVHVQYGSNVILDDINWTILPNEKWALLGPNGAGKSTLLSLINGDNPQAYANNIVLFDRKRGTGESIWDIKRNIGFVSPELHQYFSGQAKCAAVVASGFYDTIGVRNNIQPAQLDTALDWMLLLGIHTYADQLFKNVPGSIQRLTLLARALVKQPPLLIFDEPCQGLDHQQKEHFKQVIDMLCAHLPMTLIFVTHYSEEIPNAVDKVLQLKRKES
ncbi:molybdate transport system ATP-binding protein [Chitinophaga skermanii]|uniref:Molybdate transport system ATP-binding protein n=1 Tax=Chitinophaga skermanii TaxID=331697 RepID=A0A327R3Y0_9BACT|nr:ATP-binding cassette domain-containing protein [Chitinophaga skermanii]RAJ10662.1 molybdate transport system ATP-binding protein [Chitinophaga skermanii]